MKMILMKKIVFRYLKKCIYIQPFYENQSDKSIKWRSTATRAKAISRHGYSLLGRLCSRGAPLTSLRDRCRRHRRLDSRGSNSAIGVARLACACTSPHPRRRRRRRGEAPAVNTKSPLSPSARERGRLSCCHAVIRFPASQSPDA